MKAKTIGIIGGAGPQAGALLFEKVIRQCTVDYGYHRDPDFPKIYLLSFPFAEVLVPPFSIQQVQKQLSEALGNLRSNGAEVISIACNTLHAFLPKDEDLSDLIHLPKVIANAIPKTEIPLVLCTTTSVNFALHKQFFPCVYPSEQIQKEVDKIINRVLKGDPMEETSRDLLKIIQSQKEDTIILGCTELSLLADRLVIQNKKIIDPLTLASEQILKSSFLTLKESNV